MAVNRKIDRKPSFTKKIRLEFSRVNYQNLERNLPGAGMLAARMQNVVLAAVGTRPACKITTESALIRLSMGEVCRQVELLRSRGDLSDDCESLLEAAGRLVAAIERQLRGPNSEAEDLYWDDNRKRD